MYSLPIIRILSGILIGIIGGFGVSLLYKFQPDIGFISAGTRLLYTGPVLETDSIAHTITIGVESQYPGPQSTTPVKISYGPDTMWGSMDYTIENGVIMRATPKEEGPIDTPRGTYVSIRVRDGIGNLYATQIGVQRTTNP